MFISYSVPSYPETRNFNSKPSPFIDFMDRAFLCFGGKIWLENNGSYMENIFSSMVWMFQSNFLGNVRSSVESMGRHHNIIEILKWNIARLRPYQFL